MQTTSIGGSTYFLTFIDDFSRNTWIYFLNNKSDALGCFHHFKSHVEKKSGYYIKCLRTNQGGEYISREFHNFCKVHDIYKQFTTRYTPHQNGVVGRKNRTIMEMVHSMLTTKHLSNEYWVEAVATVVYILKKCPTKSVKNRFPQEAWTRLKHNVAHLKKLVVLHMHMFLMS
jgi:transposase InsO family protein